MNKAQEKINELWTRGAKNYNRIIDDEISSFRSAGWKKQKLKARLKYWTVAAAPDFSPA